MNFHLALEQGYLPETDTAFDRFVVYFDEKPRHAVFLTLGKPYTLEKLIEGLEDLKKRLEAFK